MITNDSISDDTDEVSGAVDNDYDKTDTYNEQMPYDNENEDMPYDNDNDNDTATGEMKHDRNMTNELKDIGTRQGTRQKRQ